MATNNTKQASWVAIGSLFSYLVGIISPMILSRYFIKADYGTFKQVMYVYHTLLIIFTFGLPRAYSYFLPKRPLEESKDIINKITSIFVVLGLCFSAFLFTLADIIANVMNNPDLAPALRVFAPVPLFLLPTMGMDGIYASFKKTQFTSIYTVVTRIFTVFCTVIPVILFSGGYKEALIGFDIASLLICILAFIMMQHPVRKVTPQKTVITYKQIFMFALPIMYASIWGIIIDSSPSFFISRYFGNEIFADFSNGFMSVPFLGMIITSVATVLLPAFSGMENKGRVTADMINLWKNTIRKTTKLIFPILIFCMFFAKLLMICMYGALYENSGTYFIIKNIANLFYVIPFAPILISLGKTKQYANIHMVSAFMVVAIQISSLYMIKSPYIIAVISTSCFIIFIFLMLMEVSKSFSMSLYKMLPLKDIFMVLLLSSLAGFISYFISGHILINKFELLIISLVIFVFIYYALCFLFNLSYRDFTASFFRGARLEIINKIIP